MNDAASPKKVSEAAIRRELASRILARRNLLAFIHRHNPKYSAGWVHEDICRRLEKFSEDVAKGLSPRLMLLMPPRHGKSEIASRNFPPWHLGRYPDHEIIACSYNVSLAMGFSKKAKAVLEDPAYQSTFETRLHPNNQSTEEWSIHEHDGGYVAAGIGGGITGKGAHILLIDDPVKNAEEADSANVREAIKDWYGSTAYTRLAPGGGVLIIQTCWHDDDLSGWLQNLMKEDPEADQFEVIKYSAIAESDEYYDDETGLIVYDTAPERGRLLRRKGEALHPERYDLQKLSRIKRTIAPRFWSALYQQNPVPDDGSYFTRDMFRFAPMPARSQCYVKIAVDFAISEKTVNDYTVISVGLQDPDDSVTVVDMNRFRSGDAHQIVTAIMTMVKRWYTPGLELVVEDGQIWKTLRATLQRAMKAQRLFFIVTPKTPVTDKAVRNRPLQARMQLGQWQYLQDAPWFPVVQAEMLRFPTGVHDDTVDSQGWLAIAFAESAPPRKTVNKPPKSWKDKLRAGAGGDVSHMAA